MKNESMCRIPVQATMQKVDDKFVMVSAEYVDIPAKNVAEFLLRSFGASAIFGDDEAAEEVRRHEQNDVFAVSE